MTINICGSPKMEGAVREVLGGASEELDGLVVGNDDGLGDMRLHSSYSTSTSFSTFSSIHLSTSSSPHSSSQST